MIGNQGSEAGRNSKRKVNLILSRMLVELLLRMKNFHESGN
jgi:hypothetical protein